jgi:hypothetical protein
LGGFVDRLQTPRSLPWKQSAVLVCVCSEGLPAGNWKPFRLSRGDGLPLGLETLRLQPAPDQFGEGDPLLCRDSL